ncbi:hypothetical protein Pmani_005810 [Petrolisthes manimaculis]|uniref:Uncharacterized protein n=1 Tax=Petrolisthes manimaculis TaxID=1843537 RepID=A0AAE1ULU7_9EUCA|nr:hypothetical protein Pmani_005810 [Petrolisthes manimaculis]
MDNSNLEINVGKLCHPEEKNCQQKCSKSAVKKGGKSGGLSTPRSHSSEYLDHEIPISLIAKPRVHWAPLGNASPGAHSPGPDVTRTHWVSSPHMDVVARSESKSHQSRTPDLTRPRVHWSSSPNLDVPTPESAKRQLLVPDVIDKSPKHSCGKGHKGSPVHRQEGRSQAQGARKEASSRHPHGDH